LPCIAGFVGADTVAVITAEEAVAQEVDAGRVGVVEQPDGAGDGGPLAGEQALGQGSSHDGLLSTRRGLISIPAPG